MFDSRAAHYSKAPTHNNVRHLTGPPLRPVCRTCAAERSFSGAPHLSWFLDDGLAASASAPALGLDQEVVKRPHVW